MMVFLLQVNVWCKEGFVINGTDQIGANASCLANGTFDSSFTCVGKITKHFCVSVI